MTEPYIPDETELIGCYAANMEEQAGEDYRTAKADAERGIAAIKAEAWDECLAYAIRRGGGRWSDNPYREQEEA